MSDVRDFGATGDGRTDDTNAIRHAIDQGDGQITFSRGNYLISETIQVDLAKTGRWAIDGSGGTAKIINNAAGPAFHLLGTHGGTAHPESIKPEVWDSQRMPTVSNIEIEGRHPKASGFLVEGVMQATFERVLLRRLADGIRLHGRTRNLIVSHCHLFEGSGVGVFLDRVNLHQAIITGSHISYWHRAGVKIIGSEIRNLQITGNDIEYNYDRDNPQSPELSADVWIDASDDSASVREATICSNTIQARYSRGGANLRIVGHNSQSNHKAGMITISGNLIGSQETNIHLDACRGVVVTGNVIYSGHYRNLHIERSRNIVVGPNSLDHNPDYRKKQLCTGIRVADSHDVQFSGGVIHDCETGEHTVEGAPAIVRDGLVEIIRCRRVGISGMQILDGFPNGLYLEESHDVNLSGLTVLEIRKTKKTKAAIRWIGNGSGNLISGCRIGRGTEGALELQGSSSVTVGSNSVDEA